MLEIELFFHLTVCKQNTVLMLDWIVWNRSIYMYKIDLALNNLQWLICHKTKSNQTNQVTSAYIIWFLIFLSNTNKFHNFYSWMKYYHYYFPTMTLNNTRGWCPRGAMVKTMDCGIVVSEFVLQSRNYLHFRANILGKGMKPLILPAIG